MSERQFFKVIRSIGLIVFFMIMAGPIFSQDMKPTVVKPEFHSISELLYEVNLQHKRGGVSSLLMIKPDSENDYKLVFVTQFGLKLTELILTPTRMEVLEIQDWMNRKVFLNILEKDLFALLYAADGLKLESKKHLTNSKPVKENKYRFYFKKNNMDFQLVKMTRRNRFKADFINYVGKVPSRVIMSHRVGGLVMELNLLHDKQ
ncbi:MAG: hypothetical protein GY751_04865 [Bacteroidetes bacterium]|nr:hypothetical protein [Bacteroidota bacterium]